MTGNFQEAYKNQTRSSDGQPGPLYWQNRADYSIDVTLDVQSGIISGQEKINYSNNSPDTLTYLLIHLFPNVYKKGTARDFDVRFEDESDGVLIGALQINGREIDVSADSKSIEYMHNDFKLKLPEPLFPRQSMNLQISWKYAINEQSHMRTGKVDSTSYFIAYFYPRIAVYDDVDGWDDFFYSGRAEFYNDFGDFDVAITVPKKYVVWATGELQNPGEVLTEKYRQRLQKAMRSDQVFPIIDEPADWQQVTNNKPQNSWKFHASDVTDFAFATSDHYLWDGSGLIVDQDSGRRVFISAAYNRDARDFYQVARFAREAIEFMSADFPGVPFPYPSMTVFNGLDEMEYPMMVNDLSSDDSSYVRKVTSHEIFHSYFPFYMGINESKYAWMDEGFASYGDYLISRALDKSGYSSIYYLDRYKANQFYDVDVPIISNSKFLKKYTYHYNAYAKPAVFLIILRDLLGDELFKKTIREFMARWHGKHPTPYDLFFTVYNITGQNLNWLIQPWFFEFGYADLGLKSFKRTGNGYEIIIARTGGFPVPLNLQITYTDGSKMLIEKDVSIWEEGKPTFTLMINSNQPIKMIELLPGILPDAVTSNNILKID
jgi:hypothetical protein